MKGEVTVGLFEHVMEGYEITGHNAEDLLAILADPKQKSNALTYVNLLDAKKLAKNLSDLTGRKFRVQTEEEWLDGRDQLVGNNWTWTETLYNKKSFVLRHLVDGNRDFSTVPGLRYFDVAVRLVEDKE